MFYFGYSVGFILAIA